MTVFDDEEIIRGLLEQVLTAKDYEVVAAKDLPSLGVPDYISTPFQVS